MSKRLFRSRQTRMIGGVCGGLAEYFDVDPVIVRALFVITTFGYGIGFVAYIVLWIIVPERQKVYLGENKEVFTENLEDEIIIEEPEPNNDKRKIFFGFVLVVIGTLLLIRNFIPELDWDYVWPLAMMAFGGYLLYNSYRRKASGVLNEIE